MKLQRTIRKALTYASGNLPLPAKITGIRQSARSDYTMQQEQPLVSVIVPVFNAEPYLDQAIDSIRSQTLENIEIICLNDGSTDDSLEIMQRHAGADARIRVIDKANQGYGATCNRGLEEATGTYIAIVEPDDWIEFGMFEEMFEFANSISENIDIIKTPYWRIWMPDTPQQRKMNCSYKARIKPTAQPFTIDDPGASHLLCHHPSIWSALYRKSFLDENEIRFKEIPGAGWADNPFLAQTLCLAQSIVYFDKAFYCYREETPEKSAAFAKRNTLLPLERWSDMQDVLDSLGIEDEGILRAHISRGFTYLSGIIEEIDLSHDEVREAATKMFERMNPELVLADPEISPGCKRMFLNLRGLPDQKISKLPYMFGLVKEGLYNLKNTGVSYTLYSTKNYFSKKSLREGKSS